MDLKQVVGGIDGESDGMWLSILFFFVEFSGEAVLGCLMERLVVDENADIVENVQKRCEFGV
jgi:hypothetical protein